MSYIPVSTITSGTILVKTDSVSVTAQAADIGSTAFSVSTPGLYRLSYYLVDSTADITAGAVRLNVTYADNGTSQTQQSAVVALATIGTFTSGTFVIQLASGGISYSTSHTGAFGTAKYDLFVTVERLN